MKSANTSKLHTPYSLVSQSLPYKLSSKQEPLVSSVVLMPFLKIRSCISSFFKTVKAESKTVYWLAMITFFASVFCLVGMVVDNRTLMGVSVWLKPFKFTISIGIYILSVAFLLSIYPYSKRKKSIINGFVSWTLFIELGIIIHQGAKGVQSHYNVSTGLDAILFMSMGILTGINVLIMVWLLIDSIRLKLNINKSIQWAIALSWVIVLFSSWVGGQMISQLTHTVGVPEGGSGLPLVNWSTLGGDLRIAHFFGLHSIQIIPLFALWLSKTKLVAARHQIIAVLAFAFVFALVVGLVFYQAKQGMPLISL